MRVTRTARLKSVASLPPLAVVLRALGSMSVAPWPTGPTSSTTVAPLSSRNWTVERRGIPEEEDGASTTVRPHSGNDAVGVGSDGVTVAGE